jgi:AcrR family transcriptional regulator
MTGTYHSPRRDDAAAATRRAILTGARDMFIQSGYEAVTVSDIAKAAQVAVPTVYSSTGGKAAILAALVQQAIDDPNVDETLTAVAAADDPRRVVDLIAEGTRRTHERHWDTLYGLLQHAQSEPAAREVQDAGIAAYLDALARAAEQLVTLKGLAPGIDRTQALDLLWFYFGQPAWFTLVGTRGWTFDRAQDWLTRVARRELLRDPGI